MDKEEKQFNNRENLYYEVAILDCLQQWKREPHISFLRILKETLKKRGAWSETFKNNREGVLFYILSYMQMSMAMQTFCYAFEAVKEAGLDQSAQSLKNTLKSFKTKVDVDGKEKTTNALQLMKIIREAFAHNDDTALVSNWEMFGDDNKFKITIQSEIKKGGDRHKITFNYTDLMDYTLACLSNVIDWQNNAIELDVNGIKLEKICRNGKLTPKPASKHIKQLNKQTQQPIETEERQLQTLCNCFNSEFFHNEDVKNGVASPFRPDFVLRVFPFKFNAHNHLLNIRMVSNSLYHLANNTKSCHDWFKAMVDALISNSNTTCEEVTHLYYMFLQGDFDSVIIANMLFSIFSFETSTKIEEMFDGTGVDVNRIRNSVMHGRFYYNCNNAFDFYDGRNNQELQYVGTLTVAQITTAAQKLVKEFLNDQANSIGC